MIVNTLSACIATEKVAESRDFYVKHFDAKVTFDCGWYVNLQFGKETSELQFMAPQDPSPPACNPAGLIYNFSVDDVDAEYRRLTKAGLIPVMPLEEHPWGDRGFSIPDPNGVCLYIYSDREPSEEFKQYCKN
ncbi:VOC family protein [Tichowtungia aerotolerans]|uniref:Glyoxalase n=1 Tax=Tichowtungia aerotolerans TaxID=2697043 RepID=A0A6P1M8Y9_9BACT|nr:VOC family protein [Tichowtungia aerotolerans]QHI69004.1 glyoxalase [Tichowtungia aerotolerans]